MYKCKEQAPNGFVNAKKKGELKNTILKNRKVMSTDSSCKIYL